MIFMTVRVHRIQSASREGVRRSAEEAVKQVTERSELTALLPGLTQSLHNTKRAPVMCATMQCFCMALEAAGRDWAPDNHSWRSGNPSG